ncbi:MAG TPA: DUF4932 domain-containing protein [Planctomycetes bacterium]|nr:DUF4932 domain-containing protein [Planctomycetota bacterium]
MLLVGTMTLPILLLGATALQAENPAATTIPIVVTCDWRVELVGIVFRLSGRPEYSSPAAASPIRLAIDEHFALFGDHPVVSEARRLTAERGISFDAPMSFAVHLQGQRPTDLALFLDPFPARLDSRWDASSVDRFLPLLIDFAVKTDFISWWEDQQEHRKHLIGEVSARIEKELHLRWLRQFFGLEGKGTARITLSAVAGNHSYGTSIAHDRGVELRPVIGIPRSTAAGGAFLLPTIVHELCHGWVNPLVDGSWHLFEDAGEKLFHRAETPMRQQAYTSARIVIAETIVRSVVLRWLLVHQGRDEAISQLSEEQQKGFRWIQGVVMSLVEYETKRDQYPTFEKFLPVLAATIDRLASAEEAAAVARPKIVSISPRPGSKNIPAGRTQLRIEFDQPMAETYSVTGGGETFPRVIGKPTWNDEGTVFTLAIELEGNRSYAFGVNGPNHHGFKNRQGIVVEERWIEISTEP